MLVNNAGTGAYGGVAAADPDRLAEQVHLKCMTVVDLTTRFLPGMVARRRGVVVNVASTTAFQPVPHLAVYGATNAMVLSFTEAVWAETRGSGVRVLALCPGNTDTPFHAVNGIDERVVAGRPRTSKQVVATALAGLAAGRPSAVDGGVNKITAWVPRLLPRRTTLLLAERFTRPLPSGAEPAPARVRPG